MSKTIQEFYKEELDNFKKEVIQLIHTELKENDNINPVMFGLCIKDEKLSIVLLSGLGQLFGTEEGKEEAVKVMQDFNKEIKPIAIAFASEGWATVYNTSNLEEVLDETGKLKKDLVDSLKTHDKIETLLITFETHDKESVIYYEIVRKENNLTLKEMSNTTWENKEDNRVSGLMSNLLQDNYSELAEHFKKIMSNKFNMN